MTDFNQKTHDTDVGSYGGQSRQMTEVFENQEFGSIRLFQEAGNLNQIARYLNEYGVPYNALSGEVRAAIADLAALKYEILQKVGDAVGNTQAYQL